MVSQALVLDSEKGELVKAPAPKVGKKGVSEAKALAALKSHSEAERRRRERINAHLATLRGLVPCTEKMDKATLLAEVISQVKELRKNAIEASKGLLIPMPDDEVKVEAYDNGLGDGTLYFKASLCCDYRPELLSDIKQAIDALQMKLLDAEISTLGVRLKNVLFLTSCRNKNAVNDAEAIKLLTNSIHEALNSVLDKGCISPEYSPRTTLPNKRRRVTFLDSSSSNS
ncbi:DNA binding protein, putative [Ricinus communis]|uniref:DNA binding protein, putative n=2 Tax=Ricinus communis TaxID=3988 RepID=B9S997_RICCO|nr:DNA binding protein, putative [Ricinus communis]